MKMLSYGTKFAKSDITEMISDFVFGYLSPKTPINFGIKMVKKYENELTNVVFLYTIKEVFLF